MRQIFRIQIALCATLLTFGLTSALDAQQATKPGPRPAPATGKPPIQRTAAAAERPSKPKPADDEGAEKEAASAPKAMDPALDSLLKKWEVESAKIKTLHGNQTRTEVNRVFEVEKVTSGPFFLETPDKGRIDMMAVKKINGNVGARKNAEGVPFKRESGSSEKWICTGTAIWMLNEDDKTYQKEEIPEDQRGKNIVNSPLPFLFGMKADDAKKRFNMTLKAETKETATLLVEPKLSKDQQNYKIAQIKLNKKTFLPDKVQLLDQTGLEIIYEFEKVVINDGDFRSRMQNLLSIKGDPYRPSLSGYKLVMLPDDPIAQREERLQKNTVRTTAGRDQMNSNADTETPADRPTPPKSKSQAPRTAPNQK